MKVLLISLIVLGSVTICLSQTSSRWYRVQTLEDSYIEMDTFSAEFEGTTQGRVAFRWSFESNQSLNRQLSYRERLDLINVDCEKNRFWTQDVKYLNSAGKVIFESQGSSTEWRLSGNAITANMILAACELVKVRTTPPPTAEEVTSQKEASLRKEASATAYKFALTLETTQDASKAIPQFFSKAYLSGYLLDASQNWLVLLDPAVAKSAKPEELQRFYEALISNGYLGSRFLYAQRTSNDEDVIPEERANTPELVQFVRNHPYTKYKQGAQAYDYLAERINSVDRLREYTDLLDGINRILRKEIAKVPSEKDLLLRQFSGDEDIVHWEPSVKDCARSCLGLPAGTRLYQFDVPAFHLQLAQIDGEMKIVSALFSYK